ncbi:MAG: gliding motility-associated C-terminal domain-containing protein, partial [Cyclobacteriaceae bacterium]|nr:gliding motility-associated C-terminal domain-containing protein [Cyclobacteriaceae bacterium HetDA_MAG_MS6]
EVDFRVMDRTGKIVFEYSTRDSNENGILINWDGKTNGGAELSSGVYYYIAEVQYDVLASSDDRDTFKGWVKILR